MKPGIKWFGPTTGFCCWCKQSIRLGEDTWEGIFNAGGLPTPIRFHRKCAEEAGYLRKPQPRRGDGRFMSKREAAERAAKVKAVIERARKKKKRYFERKRGVM